MATPLRAPEEAPGGIRKPQEASGIPRVLKFETTRLESSNIQASGDFGNGEVEVRMAQWRRPFWAQRKTPDASGGLRQPQEIKSATPNLESANLLEFGPFGNGEVEVRMAQRRRPSGRGRKPPKAPGSLRGLK